MITNMIEQEDFPEVFELRSVANMSIADLFDQGLLTEEVVLQRRPYLLPLAASLGLTIFEFLKMSYAMGSENQGIAREHSQGSSEIFTKEVLLSNLTTKYKEIFNLESEHLSTVTYFGMYDRHAVNGISTFMVAGEKLELESTVMDCVRPIKIVEDMRKGMQCSVDARVFQIVEPSDSPITLVKDSLNIAISVNFVSTSDKEARACKLMIGICNQDGKVSFTYEGVAAFMPLEKGESILIGQDEKGEWGVIDVVSVRYEYLMSVLTGMFKVCKTGTSFNYGVGSSLIFNQDLIKIFSLCKFSMTKTVIPKIRVENPPIVLKVPDLKNTYVDFKSVYSRGNRVKGATKEVMNYSGTYNLGLRLDLILRGNTRIEINSYARMIGIPVPEGSNFSDYLNGYVSSRCRLTDQGYECLGKVTDRPTAEYIYEFIADFFGWKYKLDTNCHYLVLDSVGRENELKSFDLGGVKFIVDPYGYTMEHKALDFLNSLALTPDMSWECNLGYCLREEEIDMFRSAEKVGAMVFNMIYNDRRDYRYPLYRKSEFVFLLLFKEKSISSNVFYFKINHGQDKCCRQVIRNLLECGMIEYEPGKRCYQVSNRVHEYLLSHVHIDSINY